MVYPWEEPKIVHNINEDYKDYRKRQEYNYNLMVFAFSFLALICGIIMAFQGGKIGEFGFYLAIGGGISILIGWFMTKGKYHR